MHSTLVTVSAALKNGEGTHYALCEPPARPVALAAQFMLTVCSMELDLPDLSIQWFRVERHSMEPGTVVESHPVFMGKDARDYQLNGRTCTAYPNTIFVSAENTPYLTATVVAHEARHAKQLAVGGWSFEEGRQRPAEADARAYHRRGDRGHWESRFLRSPVHGPHSRVIPRAPKGLPPGGPATGAGACGGAKRPLWERPGLALLD